MDRAAITTLLILLLGVWIHPFLLGASTGPATSNAQEILSDITGAPSTTRPTTGLSSPTTAATTQTVAVGPATTQAPVDPATRPAETKYKVVRGEEGFWRLAQTQDGAWWFLSPTGEREFLNTVTTVQPMQLGRDKDGPHYQSRDFTGSEKPTDGELEAWGIRTLARVKEVGFKSLGAWCNPIFHKLDVPMSRDLNIWAWMQSDSPRLYSPNWVPTAEVAVKTQVEPLRDNKQLVGYFTDNELDWTETVSGPGAYFNHLAVDDPNRVQVLSVIRQVWPTVQAFNAEWNTTIGDWKELDGWSTLPTEPATAHSRLFSAWLGKFAEDYFRITTTLIRKYDPNHLVLGVRFKGYAPREVVKASKAHTDAQSLNYYVSDARLDLDMFRMINEESGQPLMITEYSFHALDGRSGNRNSVGFAAQVLDQQARAEGYKLFTTRLARVPWIVGADWFQWGDEPPSGRSADGEDVNFGIVDIDDRGYDVLTQAIRETTPQLNTLHAKSVQDDGAEIWRESFANKPVVRVPYLKDKIRLNGELSDWPSQCKLQGIRHSQSVGLDRSKLPVPNVYLGWTDDGLYMGLEVFDNDIQGVPGKGWWWTRDHVEFFVSTRPVASDQTWYDHYCGQFFFTPNDSPDSAGLMGTVGQWKRTGDALTDHLIPHPDIRQSVRVMPDRYVVEMFMPAKALHGWDPRSHPQMAFNLYARNFQHAIDYFWSAPKEVMTHLRPNTWGTMYMEAPSTIVETAQSGTTVPAISRQ